MVSAVTSRISGGLRGPWRPPGAPWCTTILGRVPNSSRLVSRSRIRAGQARPHQRDGVLLPHQPAGSRARRARACRCSSIRVGSGSELACSIMPTAAAWSLEAMMASRTRGLPSSAMRAGFAPRRAARAGPRPCRGRSGSATGCRAGYRPAPARALLSSAVSSSNSEVRAGGVSEASRVTASRSCRPSRRCRLALVKSCGLGAAVHLVLDHLGQAVAGDGRPLQRRLEGACLARDVERGRRQAGDGAMQGAVGQPLHDAGLALAHQHDADDLVEPRQVGRP